MTTRTPHRARAAWSALAVAAIAVGALGFAVPASAATSAITENGGAARHEEDQTQAIRDALVDGPAKNVILLIGDGMGDSEITVARNYAEGAAGEFAGIDALPLTGSYTTWAVSETGAAVYASESASTASAWSTGTKTVNGKLSVDYQDAPQATLLEIAKANGKKTGNVSTAEIQDATPGAEVSHVPSRRCYGPDTMANCPDQAIENGGAGSISEQLLNVRPDVTLGGGAASFEQIARGGPWEGQTLFAQAEDRGYHLVDDAEGLASVTAADARQPLLGLFASGNLPVRWQGPAATDIADPATETLPEAVACTENPERLASELSLASLTSTAIELLDNGDGFFLQVEGASIDKQDHAANACGQIGETVDLDEAVQVALAYAAERQDTLVVVTADHAHTSQIVEGAIPGLNTHLLTADGQPMIVAYGTAVEGGSQQHTGAQVRIAGYGPGAANVIGLSDQTDLFFTSANALQLDRDLTPLSADATLAVPSEVAPGAEFPVTVEGLDADWQASAAVGDGESLGQADVLNGTATFTAVAPRSAGATSVTLTGAQTGVELTAQITVTANPAPVPSPSPSQTAAAAAPMGGGGPLAITGGGVPWVLGGIAVAFLAVGAYAVIRRRRTA